MQKNNAAGLDAGYERGKEHRNRSVIEMLPKPKLYLNECTVLELLADYRRGLKSVNGTMNPNRSYCTKEYFPIQTLE